jgi:triacylglycerol lipase
LLLSITVFEKEISMIKPFKCLLAMLALLCMGAQAQTVVSKTYAATKYPIVMVHGFMGFDDIFGVDYFYQVPDTLRKNGAKVYVAAVSQVNATTVRGEQLLKQMQHWAAKDGIKKFHLIGHSQGGPTARYVAGVAPSMVASVTTMAGPTVFTEQHMTESNIEKALTNYASMVQATGSFIAWISGKPELPQDVSALKLKQELDDFAVRFPAGLPKTYCGEGASLVDGVY